MPLTGMKIPLSCFNSHSCYLSLDDIIIVRRWKLSLKERKKTLSWPRMGNLRLPPCDVDCARQPDTYGPSKPSPAACCRVHGTFWRLYNTAFKGNTWRNLLSAIMSCLLSDKQTRCSCASFSPLSCLTDLYHVHFVFSLFI